MRNSFTCALKGIVRTVSEERNMRIHLCFSYYVVLAGIVTRLSRLEWAAVLLCMGLVTALELINTAIERLSDRVTRERDESIAAAKDAAAGAVLTGAVFSAAVGLVVFLGGGHPRTAWEFAVKNPYAAAGILMTLLPAILFVRGKKDKNDQ